MTDANQAEISPDDFIRQADMKVQEIDAELETLKATQETTRARIKELRTQRDQFARIAGVGVKRTRTVKPKAEPQPAPSAPAAFVPQT